MESFLKNINLSGDDLQCLCLCHSTFSKAGEKILKDNFINVSECNVFKKRLVYLFYGIPAYKKKVAVIQDCALHNMVFLLDEKNIKKDRLFPFDTGAYHGGAFDRHISKCAYNLDEFEIASGDAKKYVKVFFDNNSNYVSRKANVCKEAEDFGDFLCKRVISMITSTAQEDYDDRCAVVEIQTGKINNLFKHLDAIIMSNDIYESLNNRESHILESIKRANIEIICYDTFGLLETTAHIVSIYTEIKKYYIAKGLI
ncbi:MAG: hypothetical protein FWE22_00830 [Firmicutes bacterium]|nr:hypothetical protein [Bacillota bacterium]